MKAALINKSTKLEDFDLGGLYIEISDAWEKRARELQARRWAKIKQKEKKGYHHDRHSAR